MPRISLPLALTLSLTLAGPHHTAENSAVDFKSFRSVYGHKHTLRSEKKLHVKRNTPSEYTQLTAIIPSQHSLIARCRPGRSALVEIRVHPWSRETSRDVPRRPHDLGRAAGCTQGNLARFLLALDGKLIWQVFGERLLHTSHTCTGVAQGRDDPTYVEPVLAQAPLVRSLEVDPFQAVERPKLTSSALVVVVVVAVVSTVEGQQVVVELVEGEAPRRLVRWRRWGLVWPSGGCDG
ncbi:hypothetical protein E2C01_028487 [Portunus trituberculatus]|uniref:Uncharacterized protein n=1 Tax=Portunus trituberculatus TaxID=210409 RepID=A0A5B7ERT3_PORTR|nr:hypothetical protein [Portunus trituberculatus]